MAVFRPCYRDKKTGEWVQSTIWWYRFTFAGKPVRESSKSARKTVAVEAEKNRRMELERTFNGIGDNRSKRIRSITELADAFLADYALRNPRSSTFAKQTMAHVKRLLGAKLAADITDATVKDYQRARLTEKAAPKTINDETGMLLRILEEQGDAIRAKMRRLKTLKLKVGRTVAKAWTPEEKAALLAQARKRRSPVIYPALVLSLNSGLRDYELKDLQWGRIDLQRAIVTVGDSKTEGGEGRTIPLNSEALAALVDHAKWYLEKFGETRPEWYVFPFGKPQPTDPTRGVTTLKTVWAKVKADAGLAGRWHDNRHTFITDLAESGQASEEVIMDIAGHVSRQMLKHYSHIRMEAKRRAVAAISAKPTQLESETEAAKNGPVSVGAGKEVDQVAVLN